MKIRMESSPNRVKCPRIYICNNKKYQLMSSSFGQSTVHQQQSFVSNKICISTFAQLENFNNSSYSFQSAALTGNSFTLLIAVCAVGYSIMRIQFTSSYYQKNDVWMIKIIISHEFWSHAEMRGTRRKRSIWNSRIN